MEKIINAAIDFIEVIVVTGAIGFGGAMGIRALNNKVRTETIEALKKPTPSLSRFSRRLTKTTQ